MSDVDKWAEIFGGMGGETDWSRRVVAMLLEGQMRWLEDQRHTLRGVRAVAARGHLRRVWSTYGRHALRLCYR